MAGARDEVLRRVGERVRQLRNEAGFSQADLAHAADLHPTYVSGVERGRRNISVVALYALAGALGCRPADLLPTTER